MKERYRKRIGVKWPRKWRCTSPTCERERGCHACLLYRCLGCMRLRPWCDGGTESELCDQCWTKAMRLVGRLPMKPGPVGDHRCDECTFQPTRSSAA